MNKTGNSPLNKKTETGKGEEGGEKGGKEGHILKSLFSICILGKGGLLLCLLLLGKVARVEQSSISAVKFSMLTPYPSHQKLTQQYGMKL